MHEIGLCEGVLELIDQRAAGRPVIGVKLRIGARHAIVREAFDQAFAVAAEGTAAQGAELDLVVTPVTVTCRACGHGSESVDVFAVCPACGAAEVDVTGGDELVLESLRFEPRQREGAHVPGHPG